uniref:Uncharacterized protein n=1 Tax=Knipowitschia caucasica TaxID=637954 RepID=A0AAV2J180_KNICA
MVVPLVTQLVLASRQFEPQPSMKQLLFLPHGPSLPQSSRGGGWCGGETLTASPGRRLASGARHLEVGPAAPGLITASPEEV